MDFKSHKRDGLLDNRKPDSPRDIIANYTSVTGHAGMFPEDRMGLWQCKLRYRTQDEVLSVARQYQKEGIKIDQIVIDYFHWTVQGDWKFDSKYWPDPKAMVDELIPWESKSSYQYGRLSTERAKISCQCQSAGR